MNEKEMNKKSAELLDNTLKEMNIDKSIFINVRKEIEKINEIVDIKKRSGIFGGVLADECASVKLYSSDKIVILAQELFHQLMLVEQVRMDLIQKAQNEILTQLNGLEDKFNKMLNKEADYIG
jgi:hypothetical protein